MTEWTVVTVVIALAGFLIAVAKPIINLNTSITKLTVAVCTLQENLKEFASKNSEGHMRLWKRSEHQNTVLSEHETRLRIMERQDRQARGGH